MKDNALEVFMVYDTLTEQYYGALRSADTKLYGAVWAWRSNVDRVIPLTIFDIGTICIFSNGCEDIDGKDINNIIVVSINRDELDFTNSIPLTQWQWHEGE